MNNAIVTGAARGIGAAICKALVPEMDVMVPIDKDTYVDMGGDVRDPFVCQGAFEQVAKGSRVHFIHAAGIAPAKLTDDNWQGIIEVNLTAAYRWSRRYVELLDEGRITGGTITFIGSLSSIVGLADTPGYHASKAGLLGLMRGLTIELGRKGVRVNCVSPGYIEAPMSSPLFNDFNSRERIERQTALGRWGKPEEIANAVAFLCSDQASYITGTNLMVDGGWSCGAGSEKPSEPKSRWKNVEAMA